MFSAFNWQCQMAVVVHVLYIPVCPSSARPLSPSSVGPLDSSHILVELLKHAPLLCSQPIVVVLIIE
jgi:hypothetical protein